MRIGPRGSTSCAIFLGVFAWAAPASAADRVGSETCKSCHQVAYDLWQASAHAKATSTLSPAQRDDPRCAHCHAPDLARAAQEGAAFAQDSSISAHAEAGVTCETCHGAGQYYSPSYVMLDAELARGVGLVDPGQKSCLVCHTADSPSLTPFDFAAKVKLIDHWSQAGTKKPEKPAGRADAVPAPQTQPQTQTDPSGQGLAQRSPR